jgi:hypothetical protein
MTICSQSSESVRPVITSAAYRLRAGIFLANLFETLSSRWQDFFALVVVKASYLVVAGNTADVMRKRRLDVNPISIHILQIKIAGATCKSTEWRCEVRIPNY